ncbi:DUF1801 domain-containing protein [Flavobacteriales bacterium]|nr:DUF1801 domain-containing protein [Flavobacteriales bacterium]MDB9702262.1 DUF1801 domain-containing protein [Flavobacteriales bacterium]MDC0015371.1 DUF1801 domain-containing protein [Flavobacteriales bacterium]
MSKLKLTTDLAFENKLANYPDQVQGKLQFLRKLILKTASEIPEVKQLEETLKWGEPSFVTKHGSTLRMDWKKAAPDEYKLYFKCTSRMVETFRIVFGDFFNYENNRAIIFKLNQEIPEAEIKKCITATLTYHKVKNNLTLGL